MNPVKWLQGYKTLIAGIGLIGLGVYEITQGDSEHGIAHCSEGLGLIGLRGALTTVSETVADKPPATHPIDDKS